MRRHWRRSCRHWALIHLPRSPSEHHRDRETKIHIANKANLLPSCVLATYCVLAIEFTLSWNSVRDVYTINTTGQLLPFIIGLVGLIKCVYKSVSNNVCLYMSDEAPCTC